MTIDEKTLSMIANGPSDYLVRELVEYYIKNQIDTLVAMENDRLCEERSTEVAIPSVVLIRQSAADYAHECLNDLRNLVVDAIKHAQIDVRFRPHVTATTLSIKIT